jgi:hypothetical protein
MKLPILLSSLSAIAALALSSCGGNPGSDYMAGVGGPIQKPTSGGDYHKPPAIPDDISYWDDGAPQSGSPSIRINRGQQKASFYRGNVLVGVSKISSGDEDHGTPPGVYHITEKDKDHKSSAYGVFKDAAGNTVDDNVDLRLKKIPAGCKFYAAPMPNFMRFNGGVGMHTGYLPGYAASHGCVRMPHHMSTHFFENVQVGTPVIVE